MRKPLKITLCSASIAIICCAVLSQSTTSCSNGNNYYDEETDGLVLNDSLTIIRNEDNKVTIKNIVTGEKRIQDIEIDWTNSSWGDSLAVFCSKNKRGYYNVYTGEIAVPAQFRRAWIFSNGLAAVQKNGNIGFINNKGEVVIGFNYPYHGNNISDFVFKYGHCVVADTSGCSGVINKRGEWIIKPEYDYISLFREYAILSRDGVRMQIDYQGKMINSFVLDNLEELTYERREYYKNNDGEMTFIEIPVETGLYSYNVGGRHGLMDSNCNRLTEPIYESICAVNKNMFRATLLDGYSEVILNAKGEVTR